MGKVTKFVLRAWAETDQAEKDQAEKGQADDNVRGAK